jgi:hypothetical protein
MKTQEIIILLVLIFFILFFLNNNRQENYNRTENFQFNWDPDNWLRDHCDKLCLRFPEGYVDCNGRIYPNICMAKLKREITSTCIPINSVIPDYKNPDYPIDGNNIDFTKGLRIVGLPPQINQSVPINPSVPIDGCTKQNQACTCSNTGWPGRCNFGPHRPGQLYCRCD